MPDHSRHRISLTLRANFVPGSKASVAVVMQAV